MSSSNSATVKLREVELYENERYIPISGWSSKNLLPTDRNAFSTADGFSGWRTISEAGASEVFYLHGWLWEAAASSTITEESLWMTDTTLPNVDKEGWTYSSDFSSYTDRDSGAAQKSMMHFVRRRRLTRKQFFNAYNLIRVMEPLTCDYCDLTEVDRLAALLQDKFVRASLVRFPRNFSEGKANKLKNEFMEALGLTSEGTMQYEYTNLVQTLDKFVDTGKSSLSLASLALGSVSVEDLYDKRLGDVARSGLLEKGECIDLAKIFLQRFDPEFRFHCDVIKCSQCSPQAVGEDGITNEEANANASQSDDTVSQSSEKEPSQDQSQAKVIPYPSTCPFRYDSCPNKDCGVVFSAKWAQEHDETCPMKPIECQRACGRIVLRKLMGHHIQDECVLRPVRCQYAALGCEANLLYKDLKEHMGLCQSEHLELAVRRVLEQQSVIVDLVRRVGDVETTTASHGKQLLAVEGGLVAATAALKASEVRQSALVQEQITRLETSMQRRFADVEGRLYKETTAINKSMRDSMKHT